MLLRKTATSTVLKHARQWQLARGQHAASALEAFSGEELYEPAYSEPPKGTQAHRTDTFVREVTALSMLLVFQPLALVQETVCLAYQSA